jgi:hypothetical protein
MKLFLAEAQGWDTSIVVVRANDLEHAKELIRKNSSAFFLDGEIQELTIEGSAEVLVSYYNSNESGMGDDL